MKKINFKVKKVEGIHILPNHSLSIQTLGKAINYLIEKINEIIDNLQQESKEIIEEKDKYEVYVDEVLYQVVYLHTVKIGDVLFSETKYNVGKDSYGRYYDTNYKYKVCNIEKQEIGYKVKCEKSI